MPTCSIKFVNSVKPDDVALERNTTESNSCTDMWENFPCNSSEASPTAHNYVLLKNETEVSFSKKGTWIEKISRGETFFYKSRHISKLTMSQAQYIFFCKVINKLSKLWCIVWVTKVELCVSISHHHHKFAPTV